LVRANSISNHSARSTSGKLCRRPLRGGHSTSKVLLVSAAGSKCPSPPNAMTRLPPRCRTSPAPGVDQSKRSGRVLRQILVEQRSPEHHWHRFRPLEWTRRHHPSHARTDRRDERAEPRAPSSSLAVCENARAQGRSPGSLFHRSHMAPTLQSNREPASRRPAIRDRVRQAPA
jgi:hypothetical protein